MRYLVLFAALLSITILPAFGQSDHVLLETQSGDIVIELFSDVAPNHAKNFADLVDDGFYDGTKFHRIIPGFMIQGGDPNSIQGDPSTWGTGDPGYSIDAEFNDIKHNRGLVSMARSQDPNSAGSQFFIVHQDSNFLDGQYTVFGRIVTQESFDTLDRIASLATNSQDVPDDTDAATVLSARLVETSQIQDLLALDEPEKMQMTIPDTDQDPEYVDEDLGISFMAPVGWSIQEPAKTHPEVPDVVLVGSTTGLINPTISILVVPVDGRTLDDYVDEVQQRLQASIDSGQLELSSVEKTHIAGRDVHIRNAIGAFQTGDTITNVQFREINFLSGDSLYTITYTNNEDDFDDSLPNLESVLDSFTIDGEVTDGGCLVATAAYGTELAPQVQFLREIRDNKLLSTESGASFMTGFNSIYYSFSPAVADLQRENPAFREATKILLTPMLSSLYIMTLADADSETSILGLGISVIALNIGMYIAAPAIIISRLRR